MKKVADGDRPINTGNIQEKEKTREKEEKKPLLDAVEDNSKPAIELTDSTNFSIDDLENMTQTCPITHEIMKDPVTASDGHIYERANITEWQKTRGTSPLIPSEKITAVFKPAVAFKKQIEETHRLAKEKEKAEKKTKKAIIQKESIEQRLERLEQMIAAQNEKIAQQEEKLDAQERKIDDLDAHIRANTARARGTFQSRQDYIASNAREKAGIAALIGASTVVTTGAILGSIELAAYLGVAGAAAAIPGPGWVVALIMGGVAIVAFATTAGIYYYYLGIDEREYARDKHLIDAALQNALNQQADGKAFDAMKTFADQHKLTLAGLPHTIFYAIAEVAKGAYSKVLAWRSGLATAPTIAYQLQYIQNLRKENPEIEAAKDDPVYHRIKYMTENSEMPVASKVPGPYYVPDAFIREGNQVIKDSTPSNTEMVRSAMLHLAHTAVSTVANSVTERDEPNFLVVIKQASVIDKEWVRQQEALASNQTTV